MRRLICIGFIAGSLFGGLMKIIELLTTKKVYTLLLNVDYFPVLKGLQLNEAVEFALHLIVSILVVLVLYYLLKRLEVSQKVSPYIWINIVIGCLLFLTTSFSDRTPELTDIIALIYWIAGHAIFGALVGTMVFCFKKSK